MNIIKTIKKWFSKKTEPSFLSESTHMPKIKPVVYNPEKFCCHYCEKSFEIEPDKIIHHQVPLLYTERFCTGKGYVCPHCNEINIIG